MENKVKPGKAVCLFPGFFLFYSILRSASHPFSVVPQGCFLICPASFSAAPHGCFHFGFTLLFRSSLKDKHDLHQSPDGIEHAEYHDAHVSKDREPHVGDSDRPQKEADGFHSDSESYIFMDDPDAFAGDAYSLGDPERVIIHQDDIRRLDRCVRA